jgi:hypothetical protein
VVRLLVPGVIAELPVELNCTQESLVTSAVNLESALLDGNNEWVGCFTSE